jgi:phosphoglycolate phosphatase
MKFAVFDCDGTLVDGQASICEAMEAAFADSGKAPPARGAIRRAVGLSLPLAVQTLLPECEAETQGAITESYKHHFRTARSEGRLSQRLFEGIPEMLRALRADGWTLGVATGMSDRGLAHCLEDNGIAHLFVTLQTADRHPSKPHPAMLERAMFEAGAQPEETVMIGDTQYDMTMAQHGGVRGIGVDWGYHHPRELLEAGAEFVAESPRALLEYLTR